MQWFAEHGEPLTWGAVLGFVASELFNFVRAWLARRRERQERER